MINETVQFWEPDYGGFVLRTPACQFCGADSIVACERPSPMDGRAITVKLCARHGLEFALAAGHASVAAAVDWCDARYVAAAAAYGEGT